MMVFLLSNFMCVNSEDFGKIAMMHLTEEEIRCIFDDN